ncbi:unnamed protein product [Taenia asiatica]|uniref:Heat shock protein 70 n=1 Tax=Taenia asiatica TaxID=60517 RepID=A0A0R3W066_TAEAS|nr:unnamed protein product [Taenia asiatica]
MKSDNNLLCKFKFLGIPSAPRRVPQTEVSFSTDEDGILNVTAMDKSSRMQNCIAITDLIKPMPNNAENLKQEDEEERDRMAARTTLKNYIRSIKSRMEDDETNERVSKEFRQCILTACEATTVWIAANQQATKENYELMYRNLESLYNSIS